MKGKFIVVEGLEGAGKSSAVATCKDVFKKAGIDVVATREPGGTPLAEAIRDCVKGHWHEPVSPVTELLLMYAARKQLIDNVIVPSLQNGTWVLGDRHDHSTLAYQGGGRQIADSVIEPIRQVALSGLAPDLVLYLDIDPQVGLERARGRGELDRIEVSGLDFFRRTREKYLNLASKNDNIKVIDASLPMVEVHQHIETALQGFIASC
ncbi:MAG: dTMP kinase [Aestuariibacter sp.]